MEYNAILIIDSDDEEDTDPRKKKQTSNNDESPLLRDSKARQKAGRELVDLTTDEITDTVLPVNKSPARVSVSQPGYGGKQASRFRAAQHPVRTRTPQILSQWSAPLLARDKSPLRRSKTTNDTPLSNNDPAFSHVLSAKPPTSISGVFDRDRDDDRDVTAKHGSERSVPLRPSSSPRSSLSMANPAGDSSHLQHKSFAGTSLPPRSAQRSTSGLTQAPTQIIGRRTSAVNSSDKGEADECYSVETRSASRRAPAASPIYLLHSNLGGDSKRRISRSRLGTSSSGQEHIDGEDSENDNAARAIRNSINAVVGPLHAQPEESETSEDEVIEKSRAALRNRVSSATVPRRPRSEGRRSSANDAVQEAASAQLLKDVLELPVKPNSPGSGPETPLVQSDGLENDMTNDDPNLKARTLERKQPMGQNKGIPSSTKEPANREMLKPHTPRNLGEDDRPAEKTVAILNEATDFSAAFLKAPTPLDIGSLTAMLKRHELDMWNDQGYVMKPMLRRAKLDCIEAAQPKLDRSLPDPFAGIVGDSFAAAEKPETDSKNQPRSKLQTRIFNSSYTQHTDGLIHFDSIEYESSTLTLPKYKSIIRLGPNILAKNDRALKYMPYFTSEEDPQSRQKKELLDELQKRYDDRVETLPAQRKCSELAEFWRECLADFLTAIDIEFSDILYSLLRESARLSPKTPAALQAHDICPSCKTSCPREDWDNLLGCMDTDELPKPEERKLALAGLASQVFLDVAKFSIWHIAFTAPSTRKLLRRLKQNAPDAAKPSTLCLICYLHDCPTHGAYLERAPGSAGASDSSEDSENDGELGHNVRQRVTLSRNPAEFTDDHTCGFYCVGTDVEARDILGLHPDGEVKGVFNTAVMEDLPPGFEDNQLCGDDCFWAVEKREHASKRNDPASSWNSCPEKMSMYRMILPTFQKNRRGPCIISLALGHVSCLDVFRHMLSEIRAAPNHTHTLQMPIVADGKRSQNFDHEGENSNTHHLDNRIPFMPCSNAGPCDKDAECSCYINRTSCEWMCGCAKSCGRRYQGCTCGARNNSVCFQDQRCMCWRLNRECDPWHCGSCGVFEVLDPVNRYNEEIQSSHCKNAKLQRDIPKRTLKGKSDVQGWGLFAGEDMKKHEYIGEYKGEVVGEQESNRRGAVYHHRGLEYLFNLNKGQEIDSSRAGNKMRFINNSCRPYIINVEAKKMFCNGVQRIMLFSKKHIDAGEELFFNYGYPKSVTKNFWERDEVPGQGDNGEEVVQEAAGGRGSGTGRGPGRPRKKGVGRKISSKKQPRTGGRWTKSIPDEVESQNDGADNDEGALPSPGVHTRGALRSTGRKKRKRSEGGHEVGQGAISGDELDVAEGLDARNLTAGSSFHSVPEVAESEDEEFEADLASQESSSDDEEDEDEDDLEDEENDTTDSDVVRRRRISAGDTRYGGNSQRAGWATRRLKAAQAAEAAAAARPRKMRGMRSARGSWLGTGGRPPRKRGR